MGSNPAGDANEINDLGSRLVRPYGRLEAMLDGFSRQTRRDDECEQTSETYPD